MTVQEFKQQKPEYAHLEGDALWDKMTDYGLTIQEGEQVLKSILPFWKRYQLRWLFYRVKSNTFILNYREASKDRCSKCKRGSSSWMAFAKPDEPMKMYCIYCGSEWVPEPNTNFKHYAIKICRATSKTFWAVLDWLHLVRSSFDPRYSMFGDEGHYVKSFTVNTDTWTTTYKLKKRRWWEYILIEKR